MFAAMSIRKRIIYGYGVVLGIAVIGTAAGLLIAGQYQRRAIDYRQAAAAERKLISNLQVSVLQNRPVKQLGPYLQDADRFQAESRAFLARLEAIQMMLRDHNRIHRILDERYQTFENRSFHGIGLGLTHATPHHSHRDDVAPDGSHRNLHEALGDYESTVEALYRHTQAFISDIEGGAVSITEAQQRLLAFAQSPEFAAFIEFPNALSPYIDQIDEREQRTALALRQAESLRAQIILGSLLLSAAIASAIALYTSRAVVEPIKAVIEVAQQVTEAGDFTLRAPVEQQHEGKTLATALNRLITQVQQLLEELGQKNIDLEAAYGELEQKQLQLVQSEKMSILGQLVAGVAHEINNPVTFIHGNLVHLEGYLSEMMAVVSHILRHDPDCLAGSGTDAEELAFIQQDLREIIDSMRVGSDRIGRIVLSLRNFSRLDEALYKEADIHEGIESSLLILQHRLKATPQRPRIAVIQRYGQIPPVECYPGQLNQVVMNILTNAIDAIEARHSQAIQHGGIHPPLEITIETTLQDLQWVEIAIADTGIGMTEGVRKQVFQPFFTTKPAGVGAGIGMSISHQIITEVHRGELVCSSIPGAGTQFVVRIPVHAVACSPRAVLAA